MIRARRGTQRTTAETANMVEEPEREEEELNTQQQTSALQSASGDALQLCPEQKQQPEHIS